MVTEIKGPPSGVVTGATQRPTGIDPQAELTRAPQGDTAGAADNVSLTTAAAQMQALEKAVAETPEVDLERVNEVREAVADGTYHIDNNQLANRLMRFEVMMSMGARQQ